MQVILCVNIYFLRKKETFQMNDGALIVISSRLQLSIQNVKIHKKQFQPRIVLTISSIFMIETTVSEAKVIALVETSKG